MKTLISATAIMAVLALGSTASAGDSPQIKYSGVPKNWSIAKIHDQDAAETCRAPRELVLSNRCTEIPNPRNPSRPGKNCEWDCVTKK